MVRPVMVRGCCRRVSLVQGGWQRRHDRVPIRVPVYRVRRRWRGCTVPDRRRRWFVILTMVVTVMVMEVVLMMVAIVVAVVVTVVVVVVVVIVVVG